MYPVRRTILACAAALLGAVALPAHSRQLENGAEAMPGTPDQFGKTLRSEIAKWGKVVKAANIKAD